MIAIDRASRTFGLSTTKSSGSPSGLCQVKIGGRKTSSLPGGEKTSSAMRRPPRPWSGTRPYRTRGTQITAGSHRNDGGHDHRAAAVGLRDPAPDHAAHGLRDAVRVRDALG